MCRLSGRLALQTAGRHLEIKAGRVFNGKMIEVISGKNAQDIFYEIIKRKMISKLDTAGYLGRELTRAEHCLKSGKKYVQE